MAQIAEVPEIGLDTLTIWFVNSNNERCAKLLIPLQYYSNVDLQSLHKIRKGGNDKDCTIPKSQTQYFQEPSD